MDKVKNTRKGFCFITFEQEAVVQDLIRVGKTKIKDIEVDVKKATPKPSDGGMRGGMRGGPRGGRGEFWHLREVWVSQAVRSWICILLVTGVKIVMNNTGKVISIFFHSSALSFLCTCEFRFSLVTEC